MGEGASGGAVTVPEWRRYLCDRAYVPECPTTRLSLDASQRGAVAIVAASVSERASIAADYCRRRGATVALGSVVVVVAERDVLNRYGYFNRDVYPLWTSVAGLNTFHGWRRNDTSLRVTGATDADAVALRLAGFVPDGDAWVWREGT